MFWRKKENRQASVIQNDDFLYLDNNSYYFDSACQSLRPQVVIDAQNKYFYKFNSCGGRVKYPWGEKVDTIVNQTRRDILSMLNKSEKEYAVAFGLNSTHLINLILHQLKPELFDEIITTDIEHNSVFLPSIVWSKKHSKPRSVINRLSSGGINIDDLKGKNNPIFIANTLSNIDGRSLENLKEVTEEINKSNGVILLDSCQAFAHDLSLIKDVEFDACFGSGHKMYAPSVGFVVFKKDLIKKIDISLIGGSTVSDTRFDEYDLISDDDQLYALLESGLGNYSAIAGLCEAIKWLKQKKDRQEVELEMGNYLHEKLQKINGITIVNKEPSTTVSLYCQKIDSHKLGSILAGQGIMCRTGYHCCHYYLKHKMGYPPLLRISLGLNNTKIQIDYLVQKLEEILKVW